MASRGSVLTEPWVSDQASISAAQIWGLSVHLIPPGALTLGTIFVSGFMIIRTRSGLSTKHGLQTTPRRDSRYAAGGWGVELGL